MSFTCEPIKTSPLTDSFGVVVHDLNLSKVTAFETFPKLRDLFEEHSVLLFTGQHLLDKDHLRLAEMFGAIEDRNADTRKPNEKAGVSAVSNVTASGKVAKEMDRHMLHLKANQLWHIDSTFMPTPCLCNILTARIVTEVGGETEIASTRAAWDVMPVSLKKRICNKILCHHYRHSRDSISKELGNAPMFNKWPPQRWPAVWTNPVNGKKSLYIASHVYQVEGLDQDEGQALIDELMDFCTQPRFVYSHRWDVGDVLIWDQRAAMHRGRPWPYDQPRILRSVCCSMAESDGLDVARAETHRQTIPTS